MIRVDEIWMAVDPLDMRAGFDTALARVVKVFGGVQLQPLVDALRQAILQQSVLHADETPVQMLSPGKGKTHRA